MPYVAALLLSVAVLAGAKEDLVGDKIHKTETLGDLSDKADNGYNEKVPGEIKMSWQATEELLELMGELGNVTSKFYIILYLNIVVI